MYLNAASLWLGGLLVTAVSASPISRAVKSIDKLVHQYDNGTWIENFAFRPDGTIVATDLVEGRIFLVNQFSSDVRNNSIALPLPARILPKDTAFAGITQLDDDVFYIAGAANSDARNFKFSTNTSTIYRLDLTTYSQDGRFGFRKVLDVPKIGLANGLTSFSKAKGLILIADSVGGTIWRFNVRSHKYDVIADDPKLKPINGSSTMFGANGIKVVGSKLYFSSLNQQIIGVFDIDCEGMTHGAPHVISYNATNADDFDVGRDGSVWLAENVSNKVVRIRPNGTIDNILNVAGPVSARFGHLTKDQDVLYVSTDGLVLRMDAPPARSDGKIISIDTTALA